MTDRKQALTDLLEKVEAGSARPYSFHSFFDTPCAKDATNAYSGSLDAAEALHEAVLPGWTLTVFCESYGPRKEGVCPANPARAWLIAILKALIAKEGE